MDKCLRYWIPLFAYCGLIFLVSSFSRPLPVAPQLNIDKLLHVAEFFVLGYLAARAALSLDLKVSKGFLLALAVVFSVFYGFSDEIHQAFVPGRFSSAIDVVADALGVALGATFYWKRTLGRCRVDV